MSDVDLRELFREYTQALRDDSAALFAGAGLSVGAGFVNWKNLLKDIADDLGLDVDKETDLIALAQYHVNERDGRDRINQTLIDHFLEDVTLTENHRLISTLPIRAVWTTNYDDLLERAFENADKRIDVKRRSTDFAHTRHNSDVSIYKMHGDKTDPAEAVLTQDDYETFNNKRELFTIALKGELVNKTFLFLGFSFTDPNVGYILGRVRQLLQENARQHYCLLKRPKVGEHGEDEYSCRRFEHSLKDLKRYKIRPVLIDSYDEITAVLKELNRRSHLKDVFISGSAAEFGTLGKDRFQDLCVTLGSELIRRDFNVISGFGLGVGGEVIVGAMRKLRRNDADRLKLWPFPQTLPNGEDRQKLWREYREQMISNAGICVVLSGNKLESGNVVLADGVRQEVEIARSQNKAVIPVGATGYVAREIWEEMSTSPGKFYGAVADSISDEISMLGNENATSQQLVDAVIEIARKLDR